MVKPELYEGGWVGKLPTDELERLVLSRAKGFVRLSTVLGSAVGEDAALIDLGSCILAVHSDPITEASYRAGALAIDVASNDVATRGARPAWALLDVLMPAGSRLSSLAAIMEDASNEARRLGIEIVGGHTEAAPNLRTPIVVATVMGCACRGCALRTGGAKTGDVVVQIGPAALEATVIVATDFREQALAKGVSPEDLDAAVSLFSRLSVVNYALALAERGLVTGMHDVTEGGLIGALYELSAASGKEVTVERSRVKALDITRRVLGALSLDLLKSMGSGSLIATVPPQRLEELEALLRQLGVEYSVIGRVGEASERPMVRVIGLAGEETYYSAPEDEIARLWKGRSAWSPS
ncbi:hydrogenase assembly protein HupF [Acidilobus sp. SCGC AC-742_E15]|nr:hydrogenase assembly protein HupF [Acidilobus sp. SCGC AC-742_E15]